MNSIRTIRFLNIVLALSVFSTLIAGCGGGSSKTAATTGRFALSVVWPEKGRLIPEAANSIKAVLMSGTTVLGTQLLARPAAGGTSTVTFNTIPPGDVVLNASAYPTVNGTGVAQAAGSAAATIVVDQTASVSITMATTIDHIDVSPLNFSMEVGTNYQLVATAKDGPGTTAHVVLTTPGKIQWVSDNINAVTVSATGYAHAAAVGLAKITATDSETGKTGSTMITAGVTEGGCIVTSYLFILGQGDTTNDNQINQLKICSIGRVVQSTYDHVHVGDQPSDMAKTPNGKFVYVSLFGENKIAGYSVNPNTGLVSPLPFGKIGTGSKPQSMAVDAAGQNLYVTNSGDNTITAYNIGSDGSLIQLGLTSTPAAPSSITIDHAGKFAYITTPSNNQILLYGRNLDGTLQSTAAQTTILPAVPTDLKANPASDFLYSSLNSSSIAQFSIAVDGTIQSLAPATAAPGLQPTYIRLDKSGTIMYAVYNPGVNAAGSIVSLRVNSNGTLSNLPEASVPTFNGPSDLALEDSGRFAFVLMAKSATISLYNRNNDGSLLPSNYNREAKVVLPIKEVDISF